MLKSAATQASTTALFEAARFSVTTSSQSKRVLALDRAPGSAALATGPLAADAGDESLAEAALADRRNRDEPLRFGQPDVVGVESAAARRDVGGPAPDLCLGVAADPARLRAGAHVVRVAPRPKRGVRHGARP